MSTSASPRKAPSKSMLPDELQGHILSTYFTLRLWIVVLSALLVPVLYVIGRAVFGVPLQPSISNYYVAGPGFLRDWFVGTLCAVGAFLYLYKGFSTKENWALNLAGAFAVLTALVPCACGDGGLGSRLHDSFAVAFFGAMAFVCLFCAPETLELSQDDTFKTTFRRRYRIIGSLLVASPLAAVAASYAFNLGDQKKFFIEAFAILVFASYWLVKSRELSTTQAEKAALEERAMRVEGLGVVETTRGQELLRQQRAP